MRESIVATAVLLCAFTCTQAFGQISNATVSGTIEDATHAVLPGVTITSTNTATGVSTTAVSNEAGTYNLPSLLPGPYKVSAELPGFQTRSYEVTLGNAQTIGAVGLPAHRTAFQTFATSGVATHAAGPHARLAKIPRKLLLPVRPRVHRRPRACRDVLRRHLGAGRH